MKRRITITKDMILAKAGEVFSQTGFKKTTMEQIARALVALPAEHRAPVFELLRRRGDPAALRPMLEALKDPDPGARIAAIAAVGELGKRDVAPQLIAFLDSHYVKAEKK